MTATGEQADFYRAVEITMAGVQDFLQKVPAAQFVELSDAGHTAAGDDNDAFTDAVVQFVRQ